MVTLQSWLQYMDMHPWHSYQLSNQLIPLDSRCSNLVYEYAWQGQERAGRQDIRTAITTAEDLFAKYAHYYPAPRFSESTLKWQQMGDYRLTNFSSANPRGKFLGYQLPVGHIKALGYEEKTLTTNVNLTYSDEDSDGLFETATATFTKANTQSDELYFEFVASDYIYPYSNHQIIPRSVVKAGNNFTVKFDTPALVKPINYTAPKPLTLDPSVLPPTATTPFASQLQVSKLWCNPDGTTLDTAQAVLIWETAPYPEYAIPWFNTTTPDPSGLTYAIARGNIRDARQGIVYVGESIYDSNTGTWTGLVDFNKCRPPDRVKFRYQSGISDAMTDVVIARLAAAELARPICACNATNKQLMEWQVDLARLGATDETYALPNDSTNPFGTRRGHLQAWRYIQQTQIMQGILA